MTILIQLLVVILILGIVVWVIGLMPVDARVKQVAYVLIGLIAILYLLGLLGIVPLPLR